MRGFVRRNWKIMATGVLVGGAVEALLIRGGFYDQMRKARAQHLDADWAEMDDEQKRQVLELEQRFRAVKERREGARHD